MFGCRRRARRDVGAHEPAGDVLEACAETLAEERAGSLPMVGEDDEAIRPRSVELRSLDDRQDVVDAAKGLARLDPIDAGVMRDLVVVDQVGIDHARAFVHLLYDERRHEMAQHDVGRGAGERIRERACSTRRDSALAPCLDDLLDDLPHAEDQPPYVRVRTHEEPIEHVAPAQLTPGGLDRGGREVAARRVTRKQVADGRAVDEQAAAVGDAELDVVRIAGMIRYEESTAVLLEPAEAGDAVVAPVEDARLARGCLRRQQRLPRIEHVPGGRPTRERRHEAARDRPLQQRKREPVDLDEDHAGIALAALLAVRRKLAYEGAEEGLVVRYREGGGEERVGHGVYDRRDDGTPRTVDGEAVRDARNGEERQRLKKQRRDADERDGDAGEHRDEDGTGHGRHERERDGRDDRRWPRTNADPRYQPQRERECGER